MVGLAFNGDFNNEVSIHTARRVMFHYSLTIYTHGPVNQTRNSIVSFFLLCPFFLYIPTNNPLSTTILNELSTSCRYVSKQVVQLLGSAKNWPSHEPRYAL